MRSFSKKLAFVLAAAMVVTAFAPAASAKAAEKMAINNGASILYVTDGKGMNDAAQVGGGKGNVAEYDYYVTNKPSDYKTAYTFDWSSSDEKVIKVGKAGLTTAVGVGEADVICKVTEKATGKTETLKKTVTVKANAEKVVISNAAEWADLTYEVGDVIDLNRTMYDANGTKTTKRGVVVTDYTRWMVTDADGKDASDVVTVNQTNGNYTFTADAKAGEYTLWCETYQSSKYTKTTAESEKIVVTLVAENAFAATQDSLSQFTIEFDNAVSALAKSDVTVEKVKVRNGKEYYTKMQVKAVALNAAKDAATVTLFGSLEDANNYKITVKNFEESYVLAATVGYPVSLVVTAQVDGKDVDPLTTNVKATLACKFFDANGVDVTAKGYKATYSLVEYSKNGGYTLAGSDLTVKKAGEVAGVKAKCQKYENGKLVVDISETFYFTAEDAAPVYVVGVADFSVNNFNSNGNQQFLQVQNKSTNMLTVKVLTDDGKEQKTVYKAGDVLPSSVGTNQTLSFTAINPEICNITTNGTLIPYKTGFAGFYLNTVTPQKSGAPVVEPFGEVYVEIKDNSKFSYIKLDKYDVSVGVVDGYDEATIKVTAYDQYDSKFAGAFAIAIEGVSDNAKQVVSALVKSGTGAEQTIKVDGSALLSALNATNDYKVAAGDAAYLEFKVKVGSSEQYFNVVVQDKGDAANNYVAIENNNKTDALRVVTPNDGNTNTEDAKVLTFTVYQMNNNTKVGTQAFAAYPADVTTVSAGQYFYKLTKDGNAIDGAYVTFNGTSVSVKLSGLSAAVSGSVIGAGQTVNYDKTGAGNYVFELYYSYAAGDLTQIDVNSCYVTVGDKGAYTLVSQESDEVDMIDSLNHSIDNGYTATNKNDIIKCFKFKDRNGNDVDLTTKTCDVKFDATSGTGSVFVESITVYESVGTDEYVAYEIPVNVVLVRK